MVGRNQQHAEMADDAQADQKTLSAALRHLKPGDLIAESITAKALIGEGSMGKVYLAHQHDWDLDLVVKIPKEEILSDANNAHRIAREAEAWTNLGMHPHITYCYFVLPIEEVPLIVVEYVDGWSASTILFPDDN